MGKRQLKTVILIVTLISLSASLFAPSSAVLVTQAQTTQGTVKLEPCKLVVGLVQAKTELEAECGVVRVPENRNQPTKRQLDIHFTILRKSNPASMAAPVFHMEGGPGASAINNFTVWKTAYQDILVDHDVVLIDQRGTGQSANIQCTEVTDVALSDLAKDVDQNALTKESPMIKQMQACLKRLSATTDPANYTSLDLAADTDAVREALGYDKINLFGNSYGTWLAQIYMAHYGQHVNAAVLDGIVGPWDFFLMDAGLNAEAALKHIFDMCAADNACNRAYPNLKRQFDQAVKLVEKSPKTVTASGTLTNKNYTVLITKSRLLQTIHALLYQSSFTGAVPQLIAQAAQGNYAVLASTMVLTAESASDISIGLYYSVQCSETLPFFTEDMTAKMQDTVFDQNQESLTTLKLVCGAWRAAELDEADIAPLKTDIPTLLLVGSLDPITPVAYAERTHARLANSTLAVFDYQSHGVIVGSRCAQQLTVALFADPSQTLDTTCIGQDLPPFFSGTYRARLITVDDPMLGMVQIPNGWQRDEQRSTEFMAFYVSEDGTQILGLAKPKGMSGNEMKSAAAESIGHAIGSVDQQATITQLGTTITQYSFNSDSFVGTGVLVTFNLLGRRAVMWYSAPSNRFMATFEPLVSVLTSLVQ